MNRQRRVSDWRRGRKWEMVEPEGWLARMEGKLNFTHTHVDGTHADIFESSQLECSNVEMV